MSSSRRAEEPQPSSPPSSPRANRPTSPRSPPRRALHDQRPSDTNAAAGGPTIRIVEDPGSPVYGKSPFPSGPSQILSPTHAQGSRQDARASTVSESSLSTNAGADSRPSSFVQRMASRYESLGSKTLQPQPPQPSASNRASTSTVKSDADTLNTLATPHSPSNTNRFSQGTTPPTSPEPFSERKHDSFGSLLNTDRPLIAAPAAPPIAPTIRAVIPSTSTTGDTVSTVRPSQDSSRQSHDYSQDITETSYASNDSTPTLTYHNKDRRESSFSSFSREPAADRPPTRGKDSDSESRRGSWASLSGAGPDDRPPTRGSNFVRHDDNYDERPPTRGSNSIRGGSFSSARTVERRPSLANLREASDESLETDRPRSASSPLNQPHGPQAVELEDGSVLHYPDHGASSSSENWSSSIFPPPPPRMPEPDSPPRRYKWSPPLSTIESVSEPRTGSVASTLALSGFSGPKRRQTLGSLGSSEPWGSSEQYSSEPYSSEHRSSEPRSSAHADVPSTPSEYQIFPRPLFSGGRSTIEREGRLSEEGNDTVGELQPQPLRQQRSGLFRRNSNLSNDGRPDTAASDRSSYTSVFLNTIPNWARVYYRRSERVSLGIDESSSSSNSPLPSRTATMQSGQSRSPTEANFPVAPIWSPRRRPHQHQDSYQSGISPSARQSLEPNVRPHGSQESIYAPAPPPKAATRSGRRRAGTAGERSVPPTAGTRESFTPRLRRDRKSVTLSVWTVPSIDEALGTLFSGRGQPANKQILFFCLGFIMPLFWILGAVLPLPARPSEEKELIDALNKGKEKAKAPASSQRQERGVLSGQADEESGLGLDLRNTTQDHQRDWALEERRWMKARWWRRVNRCMSLVGLGVIAAVVAVAVITTT